MAVNVLHKKLANDRAIAKVDSDVLHYTQLVSKTSKKYLDGLYVTSSKVMDI